MPLTYHHIAIQCFDLDRCERFYREVLGLPVVRRWPRDGGGDRSVWLGVGGRGEGFLALERADGPPQARPWRDGAPGLHLLALRIAPGERRAWEDRLEEAGVLVVHRTRWTIYFHDPEGNRIGLSHHPHDVDEPGLSPDVRGAASASPDVDDPARRGGGGGLSPDLDGPARRGGGGGLSPDLDGPAKRGGGGGGA